MEPTLGKSSGHELHVLGRELGRVGAGQASAPAPLDVELVDERRPEAEQVGWRVTRPGHAVGVRRIEDPVTDPVEMVEDERDLGGLHDRSLHDRPIDVARARQVGVRVARTAAGEADGLAIGGGKVVTHATCSPTTRSRRPRGAAGRHLDPARLRRSAAGADRGRAVEGDPAGGHDRRGRDRRGRGLSRRRRVPGLARGPLERLHRRGTRGARRPGLHDHRRHADRRRAVPHRRPPRSRRPTVRPAGPPGLSGRSRGGRRVPGRATTRTSWRGLARSRTRRGSRR